MNSGQQAHAQGQQADMAQVIWLSGKGNAAPESALQSSRNLCSFSSFILYYAIKAALLPVSSCALPHR